MFTDDYGNRRFPGLYRGIVFDTRDPLARGRIRLQVPQVLFDEITDWAWAKRDPGAPEVTPAVGAGVWVQFEGGDPSYPVWVGTFTSAATGGAGPTGPTGPTGAGGALGYYGSFYDMTDQPLVSTSVAQVIAIGTTAEANGVSIVSGNRVTFPNAGTYSLTFSIQITNYANSVQKAIFWVKKNGVDYPDSATELDLAARKSAGIPNRQVITINYVATAAAADYVQVYWSGDSVDLTVEALPAGTSPVSPAVPSIILTAVQVMYTQLGPTGAAGATGGVGPTGSSGVLTQSTAPTNTQVIWMDTTVTGSQMALTDLTGVAVSSPTLGQTLIHDGTNFINTTPPSYNYIINGAFDIWQRGISGFTTSGVYQADRWVARWDAGTATVGQSTDVPSNQGLGYSISVASTSGTNPKIYQRIEAAQSRQFAGKTITLSVWAKSTVGTAGLVWGANYPGADDNWSSETVDQSGTFTASMTVGSWTRYAATFTANALATRGYGIIINRNVTTTSTTTLWTGVQLEDGSVATPFRRNASSIQAELDACQRYYIRLTGNAATDVTYFGHGFCYDGNNTRFGIPLPTTMRVTPAAIEYNSLRGRGGVNLDGTITLYAAGSRPGLLSVNLADGSAATNDIYVLEGLGSGNVPYLAASAEL